MSFEISHLNKQYWKSIKPTVLYYSGYRDTVEWSLVYAAEIEEYSNKIRFYLSETKLNARCLLSENENKNFYE